MKVQISRVNREGTAYMAVFKELDDASSEDLTHLIVELEEIKQLALIKRRQKIQQEN